MFREGVDGSRSKCLCQEGMKGVCLLEIGYGFGWVSGWSQGLSDLLTCSFCDGEGLCVGGLFVGFSVWGWHNTRILMMKSSLLEEWRLGDYGIYETRWWKSLVLCQNICLNSSYFVARDHSLKFRTLTHLSSHWSNLNLFEKVSCIMYVNSCTKSRAKLVYFCERVHSVRILPTPPVYTKCFRFPWFHLLVWNRVDHVLSENIFNLWVQYGFILVV